jgi:hypothetical protein
MSITKKNYFHLHIRRMALKLIELYREYFYCVDQVHGSALHGRQCPACCEAPMNFFDESAYLLADNVRNEVI